VAPPLYWQSCSFRNFEPSLSYKDFFGLILLFALVQGPLLIGQWFFDFHYMILGSMLAILGSQILSLGLSAKLYAVTERFGEEDRLIRSFLRHFTLEKGLIIGLLMCAIGLGANISILVKWIEHNFANIFELRTGLLALTFTVIGIQVIFSSFFFSLLLVPKQR